MKTAAIILSIISGAAFTLTGCQEPSEVGTSEESLTTKTETLPAGMSKEVPAVTRRIITRGEGKASDSPWAKITFPSKGQILFDGSDGHPLLDIADKGLTFTGKDQFVEFMIDNFNAIEERASDGTRSFRLSIGIIGDVGYADQATDQSFRFNATLNPVLSILGGKEGTIHVLDSPPVPVQKSLGVGCVERTLNQESPVTLKQCISHSPSIWPNQPPSLPDSQSTFASSETPVPPPSEPTYRSGGCQPETTTPGWPAPSGYPNSGGTYGRCIPIINQNPPTGPSLTAPEMSLDIRILTDSTAVHGIVKARTYIQRGILLAPAGPKDGLKRTCSRHDVSGLKEHFDTVLYPADRPKSFSYACFETWAF